MVGLVRLQDKLGVAKTKYSVIGNLNVDLRQMLDGPLQVAFRSRWRDLCQEHRQARPAGNTPKSPTKLSLAIQLVQTTACAFNRGGSVVISLPCT